MNDHPSSSSLLPDSPAGQPEMILDVDFEDGVFFISLRNIGLNSLCRNYWQRDKNGLVASKLP